ncbi:hypothetical protein [Streptomyces triticirhizae]|nr:hypothetical protein [Streptomyces triticirhizae]
MAPRPPSPALLALAHGERVPVLVDGDRPAIGWPEPDSPDELV